MSKRPHPSGVSRPLPWGHMPFDSFGRSARARAIYGDTFAVETSEFASTKA